MDWLQEGHNDSHRTVGLKVKCSHFKVSSAVKGEKKTLSSLVENLETAPVILETQELPKARPGFTEQCGRKINYTESISTSTFLHI